MLTKLTLAVCALAACTASAHAQSPASDQLQSASLSSTSNIEIQQTEFKTTKRRNQFANLKTGPLADFYELVAQHSPKMQKNLQQTAQVIKLAPDPEKLGKEIAANEQARQ